MFFSFASNLRAVFFPMVLICTVGALSMPVQGAVHLLDEVGAADHEFGRSMTEIEDLNGDGKWEFLVGAPGAPSGSGGGAVFLWLGGTELTVAADYQWTGVIPEQFGWSVARIGDVNDDGKPDWAVGAPTSNEGGLGKGKVYLFYGNANPAVITPVGILGEIGGDNFGFSVSAAGDFDNDGVDDLIIGAPNGAAGLGAAYVVFGKSGGVSTDLADALRLDGPVNGSTFGWSVTDVGNFLGGADCVAVGAPLATSFGLEAGAVYVYEGGSSPNNISDHEISSSGIKAGGQYGFAVRGVGRWDGDNLDDLAIGAPFANDAGADAGRAEIVFGESFGPPSSTGDRFVNGEVGGDNLGFSLARLYDVIGTSADDLLIGAPFHDQPQTDAGKAYVFAGGSSSGGAGGLFGYENVPLMPGTEADDFFGTAVASAGDFDGDGLWDAAVGAPNGNILTNARAGFARLYDTSGGVVPAFVTTWSAGWVPAGASGVIQLSFAFSVPATSFVDVTLSRQVLDENRQVADSQVLWSGRPLSGTTAAGVLAVDGEGFTFADPGPAVGTTGVGAINYSIEALTADGFSFTLDALSGPEDLRFLSGSASLLALQPAWPNPANPAVSVRFRGSVREQVNVRIFDVRGGLVRTLYRGNGTGDWQNLIWNGRTDTDRAAASGLYFIRLDNGDRSLKQRVVLAR